MYESLQKNTSQNAILILKKNVVYCKICFDVCVNCFDGIEFK